MMALSVSSVLGKETRNLGTEILPEGVHYTAWAPERTRMEVIVSHPAKRTILLNREKGGYFTGLDPEGRTGDLYTMTVDGRANLPDLASRYQPHGLKGPSMVIDPEGYDWQAKDWSRPSWKGQVVYELHVGTFTKEGSYRAAIDRLDHLADLGVTVLEIMPLAECTGERNWGYDGVLLFAPYHPYGAPEDLRALIDACHLRGLAVMLDVVYNHIGAIGGCTDEYSKHLSHFEQKGSWGKSFNLHEANCDPVRHLLLQNIVYWLDEFRFDGFRLDATQAIHDESEKHLLVHATELIHDRGAFVTAEDDRNIAEILRPRAHGGWELDAVWSDDFHHAMRVSQTKETHTYLGRYSGALEELGDMLTHGWYFRGQPHPKVKKTRGSECAHLLPEQFVCCLSNHDQVGNRPFGERLHQTISPEAWRALSLFFCLIPYTPMLFMGQEWSAGSPFLYFTNHPAEFGRLVTEGRARDFQFASLGHSKSLPDCQEEATFMRSKLEWAELSQPPHQGVHLLYREALHLRQKLFQRANPPRDRWRVETEGAGLVMEYLLARVTIRVSFWPSAPPDQKFLSALPVVMRSNETRFGGNPFTQGPESIVQIMQGRSFHQKIKRIKGGAYLRGDHCLLRQFFGAKRRGNYRSQFFSKR